MAFDRYHIQIVGRLILTWGLGIGGLYLILIIEFWLAGLWLLLFSCIVLINLIIFTNRYRRGLFQFLEAIKQRDFSLTVPMPGNNTSDLELKQAYREILEVFRELSSERASQHHFLNAILAEVNISLVVLDQQGEIVLFNPAFGRLVGKKQMINLKSLAHLPTTLLNAILQLPNNEKSLVRIAQTNRIQVLSVQCSHLIVKENQYRILTLQDIRAELDEKELDAWQKLIRILTHEIMNSAIPVATLTSVTRQNLENKSITKDDTFSQQEVADLVQSLRIIENRSRGLASFVDAYRSMTNIKVPEFTTIALLPLLEEVVALLRQSSSLGNVEINIQVAPKQLSLAADRAMMEQVLINLIKNALDAVATVTTPKIAISAAMSGGRLQISVADNGEGISPEVLDQIFVPFYTTKANGSGIGLSLSRQIIRLHGGTLSAMSTVGEGSRFDILI